MFAVSISLGTILGKKRFIWVPPKRTIHLQIQHPSLHTNTLRIPLHTTGIQGIAAYIFAVLVFYSEGNIHQWNIGNVIPTLIVPGFFNTDGGGPNTLETSAGPGYSNCLVAAYFYCTDRSVCGLGGSELPAPFTNEYYNAPFTPSQQGYVDLVQDCQMDRFPVAGTNYPVGMNCSDVEYVGVLNPMAYCQIGSGMWLQLQLACQLLLFQSRVPGMVYD